MPQASVHVSFFELFFYGDKQFQNGIKKTKVGLVKSDSFKDLYIDVFRLTLQFHL